MAFQTNRRRFLEAIALSGAEFAAPAKAHQKEKLQSSDRPSQSSAGETSDNRASSRSVKSGDAYAQFDPDTATWTCGSSLIKQRLQLRDGKFLLLSLENRLTGTEFAAASDSDEFRFVFAGRERSGATGGYKLKNYRQEILPVPKASPGIDPGVSLSIVLDHPQFEVALHYDVYASTPRTPLGMIRKWYSVSNKTDQTQPLTEISMNHLRLRGELGPRLSLNYWRGGGEGGPANELHSEPLVDPLERNRTFYSTEGAPGYRADDVFDGSSSYHPYFVLQDGKAGEGLFLGFNYLGPWSVRVWNALYPGRDSFLVSSQSELHTEPVAPGATFEVPNSMVGVYKGDLDSASEQLYDWQATFKWDYTREQYVWTTTIGDGDWYEGRNQPNRTEMRMREMWRVAELCRRTGAQVAHEDDFWFDQRGRGVWEGNEWGPLVSYLRESGILFTLWMPPNHFAPGTPVDVEHPDWAPVPKRPDGVTDWYGLGFCVAASGAHEYMRRFILEREKRYGDYWYRLDGWVQVPCWAENHDHPPGQPHVQQYRHFLRLLREVKEANPRMGIQGCNSGGEWCNWDKLELVEANQPSDGGGPDDVYYLSYFWPYGKIALQFAVETNNKLDEAALTRLKRDVLLRRYLLKKGVMGRFMRVYHPKAEGTPDQHTYLQLSNAERSKAIVLQDTMSKGEVVVYPKRLLSELTYDVEWRWNKHPFKATGAELMSRGIRFVPKQEDEIILLNLSDAPGLGNDRTPPTVPQEVRKQRATYNGKSGVAIRWTPSEDNVIVAEYLVLRDGKPLDTVAIGTFYFDAGEGSGIDRRYEVLAMDGDGNQSATALATA